MIALETKLGWLGRFGGLLRSVGAKPWVQLYLLTCGALFLIGFLLGLLLLFGALDQQRAWSGARLVQIDSCRVAPNGSHWHS